MRNNAFTHPFYNRDICGLIMDACARVGPVTACRLASTCRIAWSHRSKYSDMISRWLMISGGNLNGDDNMQWDMWLAYCLRYGQSVTHMLPDWARDDAMYRGLLSVYAGGVLKMKEPCEEDYIVACRRNGRIIKDIPAHLITYAIELASVQECGLLSRDHVRMQTQEIVDTAIDADARSIQFVKELTEELCLRAMEKDIEAFRYISDRSRTAAMYNMAAEHRSLLITFRNRQITQGRIALAMIASRWDVQNVNDLLYWLKRKHLNVHTPTWQRIFEGGLNYERVYECYRTVEFYTAVVLAIPESIKSVPCGMRPMVQDGVAYAGKHK
jgi:hypothetical protein